MKPVTYDFDVVTDAPRIAQSPRSRPPQRAETTPHADADDERRTAAPPKLDERGKVRAAE